MDGISLLSQTVNQLKTSISCPICFDVLVDPVATKCNHHFCSQCFKKLFKSRGKHHCPVCNISLTRRSCAQNDRSLVSIVDAVKDVIESLKIDTGIDFSTEIMVPPSSREATSTSEIIEIPVNEKRQINDLNQDNPKNLDKIVTASKNNLKQYHRNTETKNIEDSFMFPADFIHPKKQCPPKSKVPEETASRKVSSWLTENEKNLNECDEMSILNGSLPKKVPIVDMNISSGEEELLSVSQVDTQCNSHLAPLKFKTDLDIIMEDKALVEETNIQSKDPYEFISSQKSNQAQMLKKITKKRTSFCLRNKKKPLGLDISRLVNEPIMKKKKLNVNDTIFEVPVALNDTFDQLLASNKKSQCASMSVKESTSKELESKKANTNHELMIFQSQGNSQEESVISPDFSSGSDDEWTPIIPKKSHKIDKSAKVFKPRVSKGKTSLRISKAKTSRKSESIMKMKIKEDKEREIIENMNETFNEIASHKLMTSSQVTREEMARKKENVTPIEISSYEKVGKTKETRKGNGLNEIETTSPTEESYSTENGSGRSPGWSRVKHFEREFIDGKHLPGQSLSIKKYSPHKSTLTKNSEVLEEKTKNELLLENKDLFSIKQNESSEKIARNQSEDSVKCATLIHPFHSPLTKMHKANLSSPEEPVKYFNLSQAEERARIMNSVVQSLELTLEEEEKRLQTAASEESNIAVSMADLPDEDEHVVENCIKKSNANRELNVDSWNHLSCELNTPVSVAMSGDTETLIENVNNNNFERSKLSSHDREISDAPSNSKINVSSSLNSRPQVTDNPINKPGINEKPASTLVQERNDSLECKMKNDNGEVQSLELNDKKTLIEKKSYSEVSTSGVMNTESNTHIFKGIDQSKKNSYSSNAEKVDSLENPRKSILVVKEGEANAVQISKKETPNDLRKEKAAQAGRKVHFVVTPLDEERISVHQSSNRQNVVFFKAGSCLLPYVQPRVKYLLLGSCMNKSETKYETDQWIIKISKTFPVCFCGNAYEASKSNESLSDVQNSSSSTVNHDDSEKNRIVPSTENSHGNISAASNSVECLYDVQNNSFLTVKHDDGEKNTILHNTENSCVKNSFGLLKDEAPNYKLSENVHVLNVGSSIFENIQLHSRSDINYSKHLDKILKETPGNKEDTEKNKEMDFVEVPKNTADSEFKASPIGGLNASLHKDTSKASSDVAQAEHDVLLYEKSLKNSSDDIGACNHDNVTELSLQKNTGKSSDEDIFNTEQNNDDSEIPLIKLSGGNDNDGKPLQTVDILSADDIFQSGVINNCPMPPPFQEVCSSESLTENALINRAKSNPSIDGYISKCSEVRSSAEEIAVHQNSEISLKQSNWKANAQLTSTQSNCMNGENVFKTDESNSSNQIDLNLEKKLDNILVESKCSNLNESDQHLPKVCRTSVDITPEKLSKNIKRARPLSDYSDDSDDEKIIKKANIESVEDSTKRSIECATSVNDTAKKKHSNSCTQNNESTDDSLLNSEELLQRIIDNINEDIGIKETHVPKLRGARRKLSDSEDEFNEDYKMKNQKLSKSGESDEQDIIEIQDDEDVFNDNDVIEGTPTKNGTQDLNKEKNYSEKINLPRDDKCDDFENESQDSGPEKFILFHGSYSNSINNTDPKNLSVKMAQPVKENADKKILPLERKDSKMVTTSFESLQKPKIGSADKTPLKVHSGSSQRNERNIQNCASEATSKDQPTLSKPLNLQHKMVFMCSGLPGHMVTAVKNFANKIGATFSDNFTMSVTHLIVNVDENQATPKTLKYLQAVAAKMWVVSFTWITACVSAQKLLPEEKFEAIDTVGIDGPRRSRLSPEGVFNNVQVCFVGPFQNITVDKLQELCMMCGAMVVDSPEGFSVINNVIRVIIIHNDTEVDEQLCRKWLLRNRAVTIYYDWLVDCIGAHMVLSLPSSYAVPYTREEVLACGIPEHLLEEDDMETTGVSDTSDTEKC